MLNNFKVFYTQPKLQAVTLSLIFAMVFFVIPFLQRKQSLKLTAEQRGLYDPVAKDILVQVIFLFAAVVIYSLVAILKSDSSFISGDALPFVCFLGAAAAFWNIRRTVVVLREAQAKTNDHRTHRISDIKDKSLNAYTAGLIAFLYGLGVVIAIQLVPEELPNWLWFISFLVTGAAIYALGWSVVALAVATEYAKNPKLGISNYSTPQTSSAKR